MENNKSVNRKYFIKTFGCQMNDYDSAKMGDVLTQLGYLPVDDPEEADLILFNTCSVRERAQEKVFSDLGRVKHLKAKGAIIGVGGCVASQEGAAIVRRAPYVDLVFGPQTLHRLPELIEQRLRLGSAQVDTRFAEIEKFDHLPPASVNGPSAFVSIMEGCSKYCSYCVVPYTRGEEISRPLDDVLAEVVGLAQKGIKEITLLGQNVNAYRGAMALEPAGAVQGAAHYQDVSNGQKADLALLIESIAQIPDIERIRFTTSHPNEMSESLLATFESVPKLASHIHLPIQHGSDRILAAMKRGYTTLEYKSIIRKLRQARPGISISSDFIVGFPGESEQDFERTLKIIDEVQFDASFSFLYSPRPGTPAASLHDDTPRKVYAQRLVQLQKLLEQSVERISQSRLGTVQRILVQGHAKRSPQELMGRTQCNRIVNFSAPSPIEPLIGQMVSVRITQVFHHYLRGELEGVQ